MDIVCSIDNNYVKHCCVMLTSFFQHNSSKKHCIHLLTEGLSKGNIEIIRSLVNLYNGEFYYYLVDSSILHNCPISKTDHLTIATYYRLFMSDILPNDIDKVLYLDCDLVINGSLDELWGVALDSYALAGIEEMGCSYEDVYDRLGYDSDYGYFNAGVLLINLLYWRNNKLSSIFLNYLSENYSRIVAHDQDVLNALLHDKCMHLSFKWNVEEAFYHYSFIKKRHFNNELCRILRHPSILHYTWKPKPWDNNCIHPLRINYFIYLQKTIFGKGCRIHHSRFVLDKYLFYLLTYFKVRGKHFYNLK